MHTAASVLAESGMADDMHRVFAEVVETDLLRIRRAAADHYRLVRALAEQTPCPVLLHGEECGAWPVLRLAHELGVDQRIGLEDVLHDPEGRPASNAALVRSASDILRR